jgi:hypothetical protein
MVNIVYSYPPNIDKIREVFTLHKGIVFTYGQTLHNPDMGEINDALMCHEETHAKQQGDDPEAWWEHYLADRDWRAQQEIQAYRRQFKFIRKIDHDRERRHLWLNKFAQDLSGPMYGSPISFHDAYRAIKHERMF